jgi:alpha-1,2-rhamnosyltransferase
LLTSVRQLKENLKRSSTFLQTALRRFSQPGISFRPGDIIVLPDIAWETPFWNDLRIARQAGAEVCLCVHDLILLHHSECVPQRVTAKFLAWWQNASATADYFLCNSQATWNEVCEYDSRHPIGNDRRRAMLGDAFRLGADLDRMVGTAIVRPELRHVFEASGIRHVFLQVGLMSPRKSYGLSLDAMETAWREDAAAALVIVGKYGWGCDALVTRIKSHPELGRRLFWFENVGDDELDYCYRRATALVTTSYAEGFNLPIVEALSRGTTVIATDLAAHREVGREFAAYFPANDAAALYRLMHRLLAGGKLPGVLSPAEFRWPSWRESCRAFLTGIEALSERHRQLCDIPSDRQRAA